MSEKKQPTYIEFKEGKIFYGFHARYIKEENGMYSWYIPAFDIYFSSKTKEDGHKRAQAMTKSFFKVWINNEGVRSFILQIHKLGFKAPSNHQAIIRDLISKKINTAKFKSTAGHLPDDFAGSESEIQESELAMAI